MTCPSNSVAGNETSSSDDDERSSPASSSYFVASGAEEDPTSLASSAAASAFHRTQVREARDMGDGYHEELEVERENVDVKLANHLDDDCGRHRCSSFTSPMTSSTATGSRSSLAVKSASVGAEVKSCRTTTPLMTPRIVGESLSCNGSDLEALCRLFPHVPPVTLECVLLSCAGNVVQCIEQLLKFHQLKPTVDVPPMPVGANFAAAAAAAAAAYAGLPHMVPAYHHPHQRFPVSSAIEPMAVPVPGGNGAGSTAAVSKPLAAAAAAAVLPLMPVAPFSGSDAMRQICGPGNTSASSHVGPRPLPFGFPYPPAALLPTIAGLRYNYGAAMMAAAAMAHASSTTTGTGSGSPVAKATPAGASGTPLPYGLFAGAYRCTGPPADSDK